MSNHRTVIVTGSSRGIGAATALLSSQSGFSVCVNYRSDKNAADETVRKIVAAGGHACAVRADVTNQQEVSSLFDVAQAELGPIVGLVNNAAILETQSKFSGISELRLKRVFRTNVVGCFLCAKEAIARMSTSSGGSGGAIVNVSSCAAKTGSPNEYIDYAMSKGALDSMTIGLAREVANEGVRVNAVRPGFIRTDMHAAGGEADRVERLKNKIPLKRGGEPEEVARAVVWLLSDKASYCNGTFIDVAGGVG